MVHTKGHKGKAQPLDHATRAAMGNDASAFFEAEYQQETGRWIIGKRVMDREWQPPCSSGRPARQDSRRAYFG